LQTYKDPISGNLNEKYASVPEGIDQMVRLIWL